MVATTPLTFTLNQIVRSSDMTLPFAVIKMTYSQATPNKDGTIEYLVPTVSFVQGYSTLLAAQSKLNSLGSSSIAGSMVAV